MKFKKHLVDKPWGRTDIPPEFGTLGGRRVGEIWYIAETEAPLPILVKWLFTSERLSIQVHPDDAQAQERGMPSGKEECWYVVDAEPGAIIGVGTKHSLTSEKLHAASLSGEIEALMDWKPVQAGDYFYIPAGTVHAIGAGITLVEVQQYADITYRLYDYGRDRELHLDDGVAVSSATPYTDTRSGNAPTGTQLLTVHILNFGISVTWTMCRRCRLQEMCGLFRCQGSPNRWRGCGKGRVHSRIR